MNRDDWHRDRLHRQELERRAKREVCAECSGPLVIRYPKGEPVLTCGSDASHEGLKREVWEHKGHGEFRKEAETMESTALTQMPRAEMEQRVGSTRWPKDLTLQEKRMMATVALEYGLDPLMGELSIYQGKPYVCINGRRRKAQEGDDMDGMEDTRPATKEERDAWGIPDGDYFFRAAIYKKGCRMPFVGWGRVKQEEIAKMQEAAIRNKRDPDAIPVVKDPQAMAAKRAEGQALMKGWHIPLPSWEDVVDAEYSVTDNGTEKSPNGNKGKVGGESTALPDGPPRNIGEFFEWCHTHFHMQSADVLKELGVSSKMNIGDVGSAWQAIIAVRTVPNEGMSYSEGEEAPF